MPAKSPAKLTFLTPRYTHVPSRHQGAKNVTPTESFAYALNGAFLRETSPNFASNKKGIRANQPTPIPTEIIRKLFQGEQKSINPNWSNVRSKIR